MEKYSTLVNKTRNNCFVIYHAKNIDMPVIRDRLILILAGFELDTDILGKNFIFQ